MSVKKVLLLITPKNKKTPPWGRACLVFTNIALPPYNPYLHNTQGGCSSAYTCHTSAVWPVARVAHSASGVLGVESATD